MRASTRRVLLALIQATAPTSTISTSATLNTFSPTVIFTGAPPSVLLRPIALADYSNRNRKGRTPRRHFPRRDSQPPGGRLLGWLTVSSSEHHGFTLTARSAWWRKV